MLEYLYSTVGLEFDGIWLDMNEVDNGCDGYCFESEKPEAPYSHEPPYVPGQRDLEDSTIGLNGVHSDGYS